MDAVKGPHVTSVDELQPFNYGLVRYLCGVYGRWSRCQVRVVAGVADMGRDVETRRCRGMSATCTALLEMWRTGVGVYDVVVKWHVDNLDNVAC